VSSGWWLIDVCAEIFVSLGFKIWFCHLLINTFIVFLLFGISNAYSVLYRMLEPPDVDSSAFGQSLGFLGIFVCLSFFIVTCLTLVMDLTRDVWMANRRTTCLWGIQFSDTAPPHILQVPLVIATTITPFLWSIILTGVRQRTAAYFFQFFLYCSFLITIFIVFAMYLAFFILALKRKTTAYGGREDEVDSHTAYKTMMRQKRIDEGIEDAEDDKAHRVAVTNQHGNRKGRVTWYDSEKTLEEYGLDGLTVRWSVAVFIFGFGPILGVAIAMALDEAETAFNFVWIAVILVAFVAFFLLRELSKSHNKARATLGTIGFIVVFLILSLIGCAVSGNGILVAVLLVLIVATQSLLLRKRPRYLAEHQIYALFGPSADQAGDGNPIDTYLCLCRNTLFSIASACIDIPGTFGKKTPAVKKIEKEMNRTQMALWTDQRSLMYFWILFWLTLVVGLLFGRVLNPIYVSNYAGGISAPIAPQTLLMTPPICQLRWNEYPVDAPFNTTGYNRTGALTVVDLALLSLMQQSYGNAFYDAQKQWFSNIPQLRLLHSVASEHNLAIGRSPYLWFNDFYDDNTNFHFVGVRSLGRNIAWMRSMDVYAESIAMQLTMAFAPGVYAWPDHAKEDFISGSSFLKTWFRGLNSTEGLENYIRNITRTGGRVVVFGAGYNGAMARVVAAKTGVMSVAFNSPGTKWLHSKLAMSNFEGGANHYIINTHADLMTYVDSIVGDASVTTVRCAAAPSNDVEPKLECSRVAETAKALIRVCGDPHGRSVRI